MSNQTTQPRFTPCYHQCDVMVTYDEAHKAPSGKKIPLVLDTLVQLQKHDCPNYKKKFAITTTAVVGLAAVGTIK